MTPDRTLLVALLLSVAVPSSAEFCTFDGSRSEIVVRRLKSPVCTMENELVFNTATSENRYGRDENRRTFLTDSWPGWGGNDKKCAAALKSADDLAYSRETYILGKAVLMGPQIWRYNGSCDSFKAAFESKKRSLPDKTSHEDVFEALGAERISKGDLGARLVDGK